MPRYTIMYAQDSPLQQPKIISCLPTDPPGFRGILKLEVKSSYIRENGLEGSAVIIADSEEDAKAILCGTNI